MADAAPARWRFTVTDAFGNTQDIWADHVFDNEDGLLFRAGPKGFTRIVGSYTPGAWRHYVMTEYHSEVDFDATAAS